MSIAMLPSGEAIEIIASRKTPMQLDLASWTANIYRGFRCKHYVRGSMKVARPHTIPAFLAALATVAVSAAHAFTIDRQSWTNPDGSAKFADTDESIEKFSTGRGTFQAGSGFFNFDVLPFLPVRAGCSMVDAWLSRTAGPGSLSQRPNLDRLFAHAFLGSVSS